MASKRSWGDPGEIRDSHRTGQGRRVRQTHNGNTTISVYDAHGRLAVEYSSQAPSQTNGIYYRTVDHLDSTRIVTNSSGQVKFRRDFFPYGEEIPASASYGNRHLITDGGQATYNAASGIKQQFTGQERDDTGLDYFKARNYSGPLGRFLSADPDNTGARPGRPQSWNAFAYVENRPCSLVDPTGEQAEGPPVSYCDLNPWTCQDLVYRGRDTRTHPYPDVYDGPWDVDLYGLNAARAIAIKALSEPDCANAIFPGGTVDGMTMTDMAGSIFGGGRYGGGIMFKDLGGIKPDGTIDSASVEGVLGRNELNQSIFTGANIYISWNADAPWFKSYPDRFGLAGREDLFEKYGASSVLDVYRAITLIHELGHAMNRINPGSSIIAEDGLGSPPGTSQKNTQAVFDNCF